jgi:hypothetical protein
MGCVLQPALGPPVGEGRMSETRKLAAILVADIIGCYHP